MKKADKYILLALSALLVLSILLVFIFKIVLASPGARAIISQDGVTIHSIDLSKVKEPYEIRVETANDHYNIIYVAKGKLKFSQATCPDQLCVKTGFLSTSSDIAVCLPHGLFIEIESGSQGEIDSLAH